MADRRRTRKKRRPCNLLSAVCYLVSVRRRHPMVLINKAINEITVKLVYYGPRLCGKTTNLEKIYGNPKLEHKGKMISMSTETDRTLFFDFMPMELGTIAGQKVRVQLYTVPAQVFYYATRTLGLPAS